MTETTGIVLIARPTDSDELRLHWTGRPTPHCEVKLVSDDGQLVACGQRGELWMRGYQTMLRYWDNEKATKATITDGRWLKTG